MILTEGKVLLEMQKWRTKCPDIRLAAELAVIEDFRRRPAHWKLWPYRAGVFIIQNIPVRKAVFFI